jgi:hypothetical protein
MSEQPPELTCAQCQTTFPFGTACPVCTDSAARPPDLEEILRASQGIGPDIPAAIRAQATIHAEWRQAWLDTGKFSEHESFELVAILVTVSAGGLGSMR